jgi:hypothetical protein
MVCFSLTLHWIIIPLGWPFSRRLKFFIFPSIFYWQIVAIASAALDEYRAESKKMVVALVDMERSFIPPQHFIRLLQRRYHHPVACLQSQVITEFGSTFWVSFW